MFFRRKHRPAAPAPEPRAAGASAAAEPAESAAGARAPAPPTQFLTGEAGKDRRTVQVLLEAIAGVSGSQDLDLLLHDIVDRSIEITGAERGLLLMKPASDRDGLEVRVARQRGGKPLAEEVRFSTTIANKVLAEVQPLRATVHSESEALELSRSVYDLKLRAVMCVPLAARPGEPAQPASPRGVLYVDSRAATRQFSQADLSLFAALAQHISIAIENARLHLDSLEKVRLEQSLELASAIQRDLMPPLPTDIEGWEVHGWYGPADSTAGDFYDFVKGRDGSLCVVVGDVTGHGVGPALITAAAQAALRSYLRLISNLGEVVTLLNQDLCDRVEDGRFLTLFLARLGTDGEVVVLNGGHALPFVWRRTSGEVETIGRGGPALGMIPDERYAPHPPLRLAEGDVLVAYTDGLSEVRDPARPEEFFGEEGIRRVLAARAGEGGGAREICRGLVEASMRFAGGAREDDVTVVVARRT
ncbi:MAG: GAF domain-containing SpoIIE family protein phosphatase [Planctomycetota bacterium]